MPYDERIIHHRGIPVTSSGSTDQTGTYTVRLELADEPGELLRALTPIADNGGNLLSIYHERGRLTPRGRIPVEVDVESPPDRFETIVEDLRAAGVNVIRAGEERYSEAVTVILVGEVIDADLSALLSRIESCAGATVDEVAVTAPRGDGEPASARLRLAAAEGRVETAVATVRTIAEEADLRVVEELTAGGSA